MDGPVEAEGMQEGELWEGVPPVSLLGFCSSPAPHMDSQR